MAVVSLGVIFVTLFACDSLRGFLTKVKSYQYCLLMEVDIIQLNSKSTIYIQKYSRMIYSWIIINMIYIFCFSLQHPQISFLGFVSMSSSRSSSSRSLSSSELFLKITDSWSGEIMTNSNHYIFVFHSLKFSKTQLTVNFIKEIRITCKGIYFDYCTLIKSNPNGLWKFFGIITAVTYTLLKWTMTKSS